MEKLLCIIISSLFLIWSQNIIHLTKDAPLWNLLLEVYPGKSSFECLQCIHINLSHWNQEAFSYAGISTAKKNRGIEKNAGEKIRVCEYDTETASLTSSSIWEHRVIDAYSAGESYSHAMKNYTFWFFRFGIFLALKCFRSSELDILKLRFCCFVFFFNKNCVYFSKKAIQTCLAPREKHTKKQTTKCSFLSDLAKV